MPGGRKKNKNQYPMGDYTPSLQEREAMVWCINNSIRMWPVPAGDNTWKVEIQLSRGAAANKSPESYGPGEIWERIYNWYEYYYNKYHDS